MIFSELAQVRQLLVAMAETEQLAEFEHDSFIARFDEFVQMFKEGEQDSHYLGQEILSQIFMRYPQINHLIPRDLLWFFGGDCLHFMPDDEIDAFQQLSDLQYEAQQQGKSFDWLEEKKKLWLRQQPNVTH